MAPPHTRANRDQASGLDLQDIDMSLNSSDSDVNKDIANISKNKRFRKGSCSDTNVNVQKAISSRNSQTSKEHKKFTKKTKRNSQAEVIVLNKLYGAGECNYNLYCCIEDDKDAEKKFSAQPLRVMDLHIQKLLDIYSDANQRAEGISLNKFKRGNSDSYTIEVKVTSEKHLKKLLELKVICGCKVKVTENYGKNGVKGTIRDFRSEFEGEDKEDILKYFQSRGVKDITEVERLGKSQTICLTFRGQTLPKAVDVGIKSFPVRKYIPKPRRCFKCQSYDHPRSRCKSEVFKCFNCAKEYSSEEEHSPKVHILWKRSYGW